MSSSIRALSKSMRLNNLFRLNVRQYASTQARHAIFDVETSEDFERKVKKSVKPVIIDFHASWCSPCRALLPRIENIISEKRGEICLAKVDIDEHSELALNYNVGSVPSLLVMQNGKVLNRMEGLQGTEVLREWINKVLRSTNKNQPAQEDDEGEEAADN